jgi:cytoskeletal protein CcmA (bactofilin family)
MKIPRKVKRKALSIEKFGDRTTLVAQGTELRGDLHVESGILHIEGRVRGNIAAREGMVRIADSGSVEGDIRAPNVIINGLVKGNVSSTEHLELAGHAIVSGNVIYNLIEMEVGAQVNGGLEFKGTEQVSKAERDKGAEPAKGTQQKVPTVPEACTPRKNPPDDKPLAGQKTLKTA